jgi:hypothetical protein
MSISLLSAPSRQAEGEVFDLAAQGLAKEAAGIGTQVKQRLWQRTARECEAMAQYALSTGRAIPAEVIECLDRAVSATDQAGAVAIPGRCDDAAAGAVEPRPDAGTSRFVLLAAAHAGLARAIAPATPEAVCLIAQDREKHPLWSEFGPLPLVRQMLGVALFSLVVLLGVSASTVINTQNMSRSLLELAGYPLLMVETFLVSAASLGGCFANLQRINIVVSNGTYNPRTQSTYWTRWVMGVISGIVLSQLVYDFFLVHLTDERAQGLTAAIEQPLLALLGGYAVDFVHGILKRAINTLGNFFGLAMDVDGPADSAPRAMRADPLAQQRVVLAADLTEVQRALAQNVDTGEIRTRLDAMIGRLASNPV